MSERAPPQRLEDVQAGDTVLWYRSCDAEPAPRTIRRVGRRWAYVPNRHAPDHPRFDDRFDIRTGEVDGLGTVYINANARDRAIEKDRRMIEWHRAWSAFNRTLNQQYRIPTPEQFAAITAAHARAERTLRELNEWTE